MVSHSTITLMLCELTCHVIPKQEEEKEEVKRRGAFT